MRPALPGNLGFWRLPAEMRNGFGPHQAVVRPLAAAVFLTLALVQRGAASAEPILPPIAAGFRGCEDSGWCRFWFELPGQTAPALHSVLPDGVPLEARSAALRDRLNALLADMIHQHKRIELHALRTREDGGLAATVTVTGVALADDGILTQLRTAVPSLTK